MNTETQETGRKPMKKHVWSIFATICTLALFVVPAVAQEPIDRTKLKEEIKHELKQEMKAEQGDVWGWIQEHIHFGGLVEFGGAWQDVEFKDGSSEDESDLALTTVALIGEVEINEWVRVDTIFLYEEPTFDEESSLDVDEAFITIGNTERHPLYFSGGVMYVPLGGLLTHFPDDPLVDQPLTLLLGEMREKAVLLGVEHQGFSVSGYLFSGDVGEEGDSQQIDNYGFDAHYAYDDAEGFDVLAGASYVSNITESDGLEGFVDEIEDSIPGVDVYLGISDFFIDGEYMAATDNFQPGEISTGAGGTDGAQPAVWNIEAGYMFNWGRNLEVVFKYAGSDEADQLGFPDERYGICLNVEVFEPVIVSLAYLNDSYDDVDVDGRDSRDVVFGQISVEF
jgi:hypothetical protein